MSAEARCSRPLGRFFSSSWETSAPHPHPMDRLLLPLDTTKLPRPQFAQEPSGGGQPPLPKDESQPKSARAKYDDSSGYNVVVPGHHGDRIHVTLRNAISDTFWGPSKHRRTLVGSMSPQQAPANCAWQTSQIRGLLCYYFFQKFIFSSETHTERGRDTAEREVGCLHVAGCGTLSQDPEITPRAESRRPTPEPPRRPIPLFFAKFLRFFFSPVPIGFYSIFPG